MQRRHHEALLQDRKKKQANAGRHRVAGAANAARVLLIFLQPLGQSVPVNHEPAMHGSASSPILCNVGGHQCCCKQMLCDARSLMATLPYLAAGLY